MIMNCMEDVKLWQYYPYAQHIYRLNTVDPQPRRVGRLASIIFSPSTATVCPLARLFRNLAAFKTLISSSNVIQDRLPDQLFSEPFFQ